MNKENVLKQVRLIIKGRVQGVFFRASTQQEAQRLGLTGWVRNCKDGSVEIHAEGPEDTLKELCQWAQHGPSAANVESMQLAWSSCTSQSSQFQILDSRN